MLKLKNVSKFYYSKGVIASGFNKVNIEFKEWLIKLLYEEVKKEDEPGEYDSDDGAVYDDRICDRELMGTVQSEDNDPESDIANDECPEDRDDEEDRLVTEVISGEAIEETEEDIYEELYAEIDEYKCQSKARTKKKHYKRK